MMNNVSFTAFIVTLLVAWCWTLNVLHDQHSLEIRALQAQVDKKYCKNEKTYPQLLEESKKRGNKNQ